jgi:hypothetical protein
MTRTAWRWLEMVVNWVTDVNVDVTCLELCFIQVLPALTRVWHYIDRVQTSNRFDRMFVVGAAVEFHQLFVPMEH